MAKHGQGKPLFKDEFQLLIGPMGKRVPIKWFAEFIDKEIVAWFCR
jgi:hypothetical protein